MIYRESCLNIISNNSNWSEYVPPMELKLGVYLTLPYLNEGLNDVLKYVDFVEFGIPTNNPKYDGPFIRKLYKESIIKGLDVFRYSFPKFEKPLIVMAYIEDYLNNLKELFNEASKIGAVSILLPDLLFEYLEYLNDYINLSQEFSMKPTFFVSSKVPYKLILKLIAYNPLFIYLGLYATTGIKLPIHIERNVSIIKQLIGKQCLIVGFAIDNPEIVKIVFKSGADGIVVGTAFLRAINNGIDEGVKFIKSLREVM